jgi:hypothetical protein
MFVQIVDDYTKDVWNAKGRGKFLEVRRVFRDRPLNAAGKG